MPSANERRKSITGSSDRSRPADGPAHAYAGALTRRLSSPSATIRFGTRIARELRGGEVLALRGELGAGKTQLVRGLAQGLGAPPHEIASPTFVFIHEYRGRLPLAHADLYRIDSPRDLDHLGWADYLDGQWVVAVEWAEKAGDRLPEDHLEIRLDHRTPTTRVATCAAFGPVARAILSRLRSRLLAQRKKVGPSSGRRRSRSRRRRQGPPPE